MVEKLLLKRSWLRRNRSCLCPYRQHLQRLPKFEFAVLLVRVQLVEMLHSDFGAQIRHRKITGDLANTPAGSLPMEHVGRVLEDVELADADLHRVRIAVDITVLGGLTEPVPEHPVVADAGRGKGDAPTRNEAKHYASDEPFHLPKPLRPPRWAGFSKITLVLQNSSAA